jgi:hypothetical protein
MLLERKGQPSHIQDLNTLRSLGLNHLDRLFQRLFAGNIDLDSDGCISSGGLALCLDLALDLRNDFSSFLSVTAVSLDNILELALVTAGNEDPAAVLDKGESDHETDT